MALFVDLPDWIFSVQYFIAMLYEVYKDSESPVESVAFLGNSGSVPEQPQRVLVISGSLTRAAVGNGMTFN